MFRKCTTALVLAALLGLAGAAKPTKPTKAPRLVKTKAPRSAKTKAPNSLSSLKKVNGYQLCSGPYPEYVFPNAGQGAFVLPVRGEACPQVQPTNVDAANYYFTPTGQVLGSLSGVCNMNPYSGRSWTFKRVSTGGAEPLNTVGGVTCNTAGGCSYTAAGAPQFENVEANSFPAIPAGANSTFVQGLADGWCAAVIAAVPVGQQTQQTPCYGTLAIKGVASAHNKWPGSQLNLAWNTTTAYQFVGSTYTVDTQYGLGGTQFQDTNNALYSAYLNGYSVFSTITCQVVPATITHTAASVYGGSGKYEKIPQSIVNPVTLTTTLASVPPTVDNPYNVYENQPLNWVTNIAVNYIKKGGYLHYSLL